ncbi:hypothetical protein ACFPYJ_28160 [Paenibacillus solisilvae]|uniref:KTSC domain-containing protein n=1 Tax=Paenibacillus solisilvae TaxID=2486751 RepID=A0ABW0W418_9BACL
MLVPVESKQIAFCSYDEDDSTLLLYYHTGNIVLIPAVHKSDYQSVLDSPNRYDSLMKVTRKNQADESFGAVTPGKVTASCQES